MDNIILIGMPGSGKSTVGVLLAKALGYGFIDTDLTLQQREGALLQDLLRRRGVEAFLDAECAAICSVTCAQTVLAPGGSAVCRPAAMAHLNALGKIIYLQLPLEALEARLSNISTRGVALAPGQTLAELYAYRAPLYARYAHRTISCNGQSLEETVAAVLKALRAAD
ncbi:MAG: shikimate kinase [Pseudoflavonifractor sp.]